MPQLFLHAGGAERDSTFESAQILFELREGLRLICEGGSQRRGEVIEAGMEGFDAEFFCGELFEAVEVTLASLRNGEESLGNQSAKRRGDAQAGGA